MTSLSDQSSTSESMWVRVYSERLNRASNTGLLVVIALVLVLGAFALADLGPIWLAALSGVGAVASIFVAYRASRTALLVSDVGIVVRNLFRDHRFLWADISGFEGHGSNLGLYSTLRLRLIDGSKVNVSAFSFGAISLPPLRPQAVASELEELRQAALTDRGLPPANTIELWSARNNYLKSHGLWVGTTLLATYVLTLLTYGGGATVYGLVFGFEWWNEDPPPASASWDTPFSVFITVLSLCVLISGYVVVGRIALDTVRNRQSTRSDQLRQGLRAVPRVVLVALPRVLMLGAGFAATFAVLDGLRDPLTTSWRVWRSRWPVLVGRFFGPLVVGLLAVGVFALILVLLDNEHGPPSAMAVVMRWVVVLLSLAAVAAVSMLGRSFDAIVYTTTPDVDIR